MFLLLICFQFIQAALPTQMFVCTLKKYFHSNSPINGLCPAAAQICTGLCSLSMDATTELPPEIMKLLEVLCTTSCPNWEPFVICLPSKT